MEKCSPPMYLRPTISFLVNEVNGQPEFRSSHGEITGVDIAGKIAEMALDVGQKGDEDDF